MQKRISSIKVVEAGSAPDIDSDIHTAYRDSVLAHCEELYGRGTLANIVTFTTLAAKASFKIMCTIYEIPFAQANKIASFIPGPIENVDCKISDLFDPTSNRYSEGVDFRNATSGSEWTAIIEGAMAIEGRVRATGVHPCGVVLSSRPLEETIPLQIRQADGRVVTQWTYPELEALGLIKFDLLGLDTVDLIANTILYIQKSGKTPPNMLDIIHGKMDDKKTYAMLGRGETDGIFQLSSQGVKELLKRMKPTEIDDIVATTALYRPGPMGMKSHIKYADRKNAREKLEYPIHRDFKGTDLEEILEKTYGLCVPAGTPILNSRTGLFVPIETLKEDHDFTPSYGASGETTPELVNKVIKTGPKKIVEITVDGNRKIQVSRTHPMLTARGFVEAGELKSGDKLVISSEEKDVLYPNNNGMTEDTAYLLGVMLGDTTFADDTSIYLTNNCESVQTELTRIAENNFEDIMVDSVPLIRNGVEYTRKIDFFYEPEDSDTSASHPMNTWLKKWGYTEGTNPFGKCITEEMFCMSNKYLAHVIAGIFDVDGIMQGNSAAIDSVSKKRFVNLRNALHRLGVDFSETISSYSDPRRPNGKVYQLHLNLEDFSSKIQPLLRSPKKRDHEIQIAEDHHSKFLFLYDAVASDFSNWVKKDPKLRSQLSSYCQAQLEETGSLQFNSIKGFLRRESDLKLETNKDVLVTLDNLGILSEETSMRLNARYRVVESIKNVGTKECYDIEVDKNHTFLVDNFVAHNCVYQEQVMQIANRIGGMTLQEGDKLRKAMGKKQIDIMAKMKPLFLNGGKNLGYSEAGLLELWATMEVFAEYGFNKSHSVAYAMNAYQAAYLKAHYPVEFMAALLAQNISKKDKILAFLQESRRMKIKVGAVDINLSDVRVSPDYSKKSGFDILYGLSGVNSISENTAKIIVQERDMNGRYTSVQDLINRCLPLGVNNKKVYENLALSGAFDFFKSTRKDVVDNLPLMLSDSKITTAKGSSLFDLFDSEPAPAIEINTGEEYSYVEKLNKEANVIGLFLTGHPLDRAGNLNSLRTATIGSVFKSKTRGRHRIVGCVTEVTAKRLKRGGKNVSITIDDGSNFITAKLNKRLVQGIDKYTAQQKVRNLYEKNSNEISPEIEELATTDEFEAVNEILVGQVYSFDIAYHPETEDSPYVAQVTRARIIELTHDGSLPVRIRLKNNVSDEEKRARVAAIKQVCEKFKGDSPIFIGYLDTVNSDTKDAPYLAAIEYIKTNTYVAPKRGKGGHETLMGEKQVKKAKKKNKKENVWPPPSNKPAVTGQNLDPAEVIKRVEYVKTPFTIAKSDESAREIEKLFGIENFDFGLFNERLLDKNGK